MGVIFVAGTYGVGKSTLCNALSRELHIPAYSAGDLISSVNGESYGANKVVTDKDHNQQILSQQISHLLITNSKILLAGHFCIFGTENCIEILPSDVFHDLYIEKILLLEADVTTIQSHLKSRDQKNYLEHDLLSLKEAERNMAYSVATDIGCPIYVHNMMFNDSDIQKCFAVIKGEEHYESIT